MHDAFSKLFRPLVGLLFAAMAMEIATYWWPVSPADLPDHLPEASVAAFRDAEAHLRPLLVGRVFSSLVSILAVAVVLSSGIAARVEARWAATPWRWPARFAFLGGAFLFFWVVFLPTSIMYYLHNRTFGLTGLNWWAWIRNTLLDTPVPLVIFVLRYTLIFCLIAILRKSWWWGGALFVFVIFSIVPEMYSRTVPMDPVYRITPLPEGEIRYAFESLAERTGRNLELKMINESARTRLVNMALTGRMGREYVLVTDTLLDLLTPEEATVMLAHELGHAVTRHIAVPVRKSFGLLNLLLTLWLVYRFQRARPVPERRILTVLLEIMLVGHLTAYVLQPFRAAVNRYEERVADLYALEVTRDPESFRSLMLKLAKVNLEPYDAPRWAYYLYGSSHPTIRERLEMAERWGAENRN